jgi:hypothetical protein
MAHDDGATAAFRASFLQERHLGLSDDDRFHDNTTILWRLTGAIPWHDVARAIQHAVDRHEILRTRLAREGDEVLQLVAPRIAVTPTVITGPTARRRWRRFFTKLRSDISQPFDLTTTLAPRATVTSIDGQTLAALVLSHATCDAWSVELLSNGIADALSNPSQAPLQHRGLQPGDYAEWERSEDWSQHTVFWLDRLAGAELLVHLPEDLVRPRDGNLRAVLPIRLASPAVARRLTRVAAQQQATLPMLFHAALALAVASVTCVDEVAVATYDANRASPDTWNIAACLLNVLLLRLAVHPGQRLGGLLEHTRETMLDAWQHRVPFDVLEASAVDRSVGDRLDYDLCVNWAPPRAPLRRRAGVEDLKPVLLGPREQVVWFPHTDWHGGTMTFLVGTGDRGEISGSLFYESRLRAAATMCDLVARVRWALRVYATAQLDRPLAEVWREIGALVASAAAPSGVAAQPDTN